VGANGVVLLTESRDRVFRFFDGVEEFRTQKLVPKTTVGAFAESIVAGLAWPAQHLLNAAQAQPWLEGFADELRSVVASNLVRRPVFGKEFARMSGYIAGGERPRDSQTQEFARVVIGGHKDLEDHTPDGAVVHEVDRVALPSGRRVWQAGSGWPWLHTPAAWPGVPKAERNVEPTEATPPKCGELRLP